MIPGLFGISLHSKIYQELRLTVIGQMRHRVYGTEGDYCPSNHLVNVNIAI